MLFDLPLEQLERYQPALHEPADFDGFWQTTLSAARQHALDVRLEPVETGLRLIEAFDLTFNGYGGQPIKGWLVLPRDHQEPLPCVVEYIGYGGGRGFPIDWLLWANAGYATLVMDTRGQGSTWRTGSTPDPEPDGSNPQVPGFMTRGILRPESYYYRRVFTDAVRAVEAARAIKQINPAQIVLNGGSQGGGISLAVAGLVPDVAGACIDVPFLCHFRRATEMVDSYPYQEIVQYCRYHRDHVAQVYATLGYFDGMHFAARARSAALFSTGLMDQVCPPSTVFAAYNHYAGPKQIKVWPHNGHEGGETFQTIEKLAFVARLLG